MALSPPPATLASPPAIQPAPLATTMAPITVLTHQTTKPWTSEARRLAAESILPATQPPNQSEKTALTPWIKTAPLPTLATGLLSDAGSNNANPRPAPSVMNNS
jgi:hypothetical protein